MKILLSICLLSISIYCSGQNLELITGEYEEFYKIINSDSLDTQQVYPDGRYKIFKSDSSRFPQYVFYIKKGMVDGPYLRLKNKEYTYGNYSQDSSWSFFYFPEDTTHKVGTWRRTFALYGRSNKYDNYTSFEKIYKTPFDTNNTFKELWIYHNGQIAREAIFQKGIGIVSETFWDFGTNEIKSRKINSTTKIYSNSIEYKNDSISSVSLIQNGMEIHIDYDCPYSDNKPCVNISVYDKNWEMDYLPMTTIRIDSTKSIQNFSDVKRQIFVDENQNGEIYIQYQNKKGKRKFKKLR